MLLEQKGLKILGNKKQRKETYDKNALRHLADYMVSVRTPVEGGNIPKIKVDLEGLEKAIGTLSNKEREHLEKFWGLKPGTVNHSQNIKLVGTAAYNNMFFSMKAVLQKLLTLEYIVMYDSNVAELLEQLVTKVDKAGMDITDVETIKYMNIFFVIFVNGPKMMFEENENMVDTSVDSKATFDDYAMLYESWRELKDILPERSIKLNLVMEAIKMFDVSDVLAMMSFANIPLKKGDKHILEDDEKLVNFERIRAFKERIFPYGDWEVTNTLILGNTQSRVDLSEFTQCLEQFRRDWKNVLKFKAGTKTLMTSQGLRTLDVYKIGGLEFTDIYEVMFLYVERNLLAECNFIEE